MLCKSSSKDETNYANMRVELSIVQNITEKTSFIISSCLFRKRNAEKKLGACFVKFDLKVNMLKICTIVMINISKSISDLTRPSCFIAQLTLISISIIYFEQISIRILLGDSPAIFHINQRTRNIFAKRCWGYFRYAT